MSFELTVAPINQDGDGGWGFWNGNDIVAYSDEYGVVYAIDPEWFPAKGSLEEIAFHWSEVWTAIDSGGTQ